MANVDAPHGLRPAYRLGGGPMIVNYYSKDVGANAVFLGDLVKLSNDGNVDPSVAADTNNIGVSAAYSATAVAESIPVWDDPDIVFELQDDGAGTVSARTHVGNCADIVKTHAGSTTTLLSGTELDISTVATTEQTLKIIGIHPAGDNAFGSYARLLVVINEHILRDATPGI